jgi:hypothetical protein
MGEAAIRQQKSLSTDSFENFDEVDAVINQKKRKQDKKQGPDECAGNCAQKAFPNAHPSEFAMSRERKLANQERLRYLSLLRHGINVAQRSL